MGWMLVTVVDVALCVYTAALTASISSVIWKPVEMHVNILDMP